MTRKSMPERMSMDENALKIILCPYCKGSLVKINNALKCPKCLNEFKIIDNVIYLKKFNLFYYSEYSASVDMQRKIIGDLKSVKGLNAFVEIIGSRYKEIYHYMLSTDRCDFLYLLPHFVTDTDTRFLDLGCGFGNALVFKKDDAKYLYGIEPVYERLFVFRKMIELESADNIIPILGDANNIPFHNNIDVALLNGVLEWIGHYENKNVPKEVINSQLAVLKSCYSSLKKNGVLVIAIENRFAPYFLRFPDHGGSYFTSFLPRKLSNLITKALYKRPYNTYTYDYYGYKNLLRKAGFKNIYIYGCWPMYRKPRIVYNLENANAIKNLFTLNLPKTCKGIAYFRVVSKSLILARMLANSYIIFAFKGKGRLLGDILYSGAGLSAKIFDLKNKIIINKIRQKKYAESILKSIKNMYEDRNMISPELKYISHNKRVYVEKIVYGKRVNLNDIENITNLFKIMCKAYKKYAQDITVSEYVKKIKEELQSISEGIKENRTLTDQPNKIINYLNTNYKNEKIIITKVHGDFHSSNFIITKENNKPLLLDWEASRTCSLLYDYFTFWAHSLGLINLKNLIKNSPKTRPEQIASKLITYLEGIDSKINEKINLYFSIFILELISYKFMLLKAIPYLRGPITKEVGHWMYLWEHILD